MFGGPLRSSPANIRFAAGELVEFLQTRARVEIIEVESRANKLLASGIAESEATVSRVTDCPRRLPARLDAYGNDLMSTSSTAGRARPRFSWTLLCQAFVTAISTKISCVARNTTAITTPPGEKWSKNKSAHVRFDESGSVVAHGFRIPRDTLSVDRSINQ